MTGTHSRKGSALAVTAVSAVLFSLLLISPASANQMKETGWTTQPIGHYTFCQELPSECRANGKVSPDPLPRSKWNAMVKINNRVNTTVQPRTDMEMWGVNEVWSYPKDQGDCEDYVLLKRHLLQNAGFHPGNLLITVVRQPNGDGHAVLTVRTAMGEFILDNMRGEIRDWRDTEYTYLKRQSSTNSGRWVGLEDRRNLLAQER